MKITKSQIKEIIKEELKEVLSTENQDPLEKLLDLLEDILSEVRIDAGAYDEPKRSHRSGLEREDQIRARTAGEYIPELNAAIELLKSIIEKPVGASQTSGEDAPRQVDYTSLGSGTTQDVPRHGPSFLGTIGVSQRRRRK